MVIKKKCVLRVHIGAASPQVPERHCATAFPFVLPNASIEMVYPVLQVTLNVTDFPLGIAGFGNGCWPEAVVFAFAITSAVLTPGWLQVLSLAKIKAE